MKEIIAFFTNLWLKSKKTILYICLFAAVLSIAFLAGKCSTKKERSLNVANLTASKDTVKQYSVIIDGLKSSVHEKQAIIISQSDAIKVGILERDRLKALHLKEIVTNAELSGTIKVLRDSLKIQPGTIIITVRDTAGIYRDYIQIPFTLLNVNEKYLSLGAWMRQNKTAYFDLSVPLSGEMSIGFKKDGLFKKQYPVGLFTSNNPYLKINSMDVLIVQEPVRWYQRWYVHALIGGVAGGAIVYYIRK
jgi:hypothetical protein